MKTIKGLLLVWLGVEIYISYSVVIHDFSFSALLALGFSIELALCAALFSLLVYILDNALWLALTCFTLVAIFGPAGVVIYVLLKSKLASPPLIAQTNT
ncbi:hypothetical protein A9Q89_07545 [Gammaproteobacteria bacterium 53_120_T64]|nr:hypothetical protein A9Q89_07545 [Gammaproteobacteria bacterium 53_120_T64]